jgi:cAMP phosphodiesterase
MHISSKIFGSKYLSSKKRRKSLNKIFIGKPEIKHISSKVIITLYTYNREKYSLDKKIDILKREKFLKNKV